MRFKVSTAVTLTAFLGLGFYSWAQTDTATPSTITQSTIINANAADKKLPVPPAVQAAIDKTFRNNQKVIEQVKVSVSPLKGFYEAIYKDDVFYISEDGNYLLLGDIREVETGTNLTENTRNSLRKVALAELNEKDMVVFAPEKETRFTVDVFTDVDCPYCEKLHNEVPKLNAAGVKVRYLAFPRAGTNSKTYQTMVSVWCAKDRQAALTEAKARRKVEEASCDNPVAKQLELGQRIGVTGTPALVMEDGELVPGYVPAERLIMFLTQKAAGKKARLE